MYKQLYVNLLMCKSFKSIVYNEVTVYSNEFILCYDPNVYPSLKEFVNLDIIDS